MTNVGGSPVLTPMARIVPPALILRPSCTKAPTFSVFRNSKNCAANPAGRLSQDVDTSIGVFSGAAGVTALVRAGGETGCGAFVNAAISSSVRRNVIGPLGNGNVTG